MLLTLFMLCLIYGLLYTTWDEKRVDPVSSPALPDPPPFSWDVAVQNGTVKIASSAHPDSKWSFDLVDDYVFDDRRKAIIEKDFCFGKPDGSKVRARGQKLYEYLQKNNFETDEGLVSSRQTFYFSCHRDKIDHLYVCPPGSLFKDGDCTNTNVCTGQPDGRTFPDFAQDRRYYRECRNGKPTRKRCQPESFFYIIDACKPPDESVVAEICRQEGNNVVFPLSRKKYIRCLHGPNNLLPHLNRNTVENCYEGTSILPSWNRCHPDHCVDLPEGFKKAMPTEKKDDFVYSPGYFVCGKDDRIDQTIPCATKWDASRSGTGGNLTHLPMVFDEALKKCVPPALCRNVLPATTEVVVPAYEFTKYVKNWELSTLYDSLVGYRCENGANRRFVVAPGQKIKNFRIVSACDQVDTKIPIGDDVRSYYDCETRETVTCPEPTPTFNVGAQKCVEPDPRAHYFKNLPLFRFGGLSPWNNWMVPWEVDNFPQDKQCTSPEAYYVFNYNVCSHPECAPFPFLKQVPQMRIFLDKKHACAYEGGKIVKKKYATGSHLNFWSQRLYARKRDKNETCHFGRRLQSGNFLLDSTLFATCDLRQPFVFCPSSSTKGIARVGTKNIYACVPNDDVYAGTIPANTRVRFFRHEISGVLPKENAAYQIDNGKIEYFGGGNRIVPVSDTDGSIEYWSDQNSTVIYRRLVNYPVNIYIENGTLRFGGVANVAYWMKKNTMSSQPMNLKQHDVEY